MAAPLRDTIYALSSGRLPAAIAVVRISGPRAGDALKALAGKVPEPRRAGLARVRDPQSGEVIDEALSLWFPGPNSETGEDTVELQLHGGRAVLAAVFNALGRLEGLRPAEAGEFTRRAFENGKLDLTAIEGLADLIGAETEAQRRQAYRQMKGLLGDRAETWRARLIQALALVEARIDFSDEADVPEDLLGPALKIVRGLHGEIAEALAGAGRGERLREGLVVAIAGPPNAGKSTLINRIAKREVAIVSPVPGTTRDVIEVHLDLDGYPVTLLDTAGIRDSDDPVEQEGVRRAKARAAEADLILWVEDARDALGSSAGNFGSDDLEGQNLGPGNFGAQNVPTTAPLEEPRASSKTSATSPVNSASLQGRPDASPPIAKSFSTARGQNPDAVRSHLPTADVAWGASAGAASALGHGPSAGTQPVSDPSWTPSSSAAVASSPEATSSIFRPSSGPFQPGTSLSASAFPPVEAGITFAAVGAPGSPLASNRSILPVNPGDLPLQTGLSGSLPAQPPSKFSVLPLDRPPSVHSEPPRWLLLNKADLIGETIRNESRSNNENYLINFFISAESGAGILKLLSQLSGYARSHFGPEPALLTRKRHQNALENAESALARIIDRGSPQGEEIIAEELRLASHALGRLTGRVDVEDILDVIFRDFCIGK